MVEASELKIDTDVDANQMAEAMFGNGIKVVSASYTGASSAKGIYYGAENSMPGVAPSDSGVILSTGRVDDVTQSSGDPNLVAGTSTAYSLAGDSDLDAIAGATTFDASVFKAEFVPLGSTLTMQVVFGSEEYLEYVNGGFNDAVGIWVNGEKAVLTVGEGDITINNINDKSNSNLYQDNHNLLDALNTEMDGVTVTLTLKAPVKAGEVNTIKIAIADGGDASYDSMLMIAGNSIQTALVAEDDWIDLNGQKEASIDVLRNDYSTDGGTLTITHINGIAVQVGDTIKLGSGEVVSLNADGSLTLLSDGTGEENVFSYTVADKAGNTDTAFVKMTSTPPCFLAGTPVETPRGPIPVENLRPGDAVCTIEGVAILRWVGMAERRAEGIDAPVQINAGNFGAIQPITVSPQHRILTGGPSAELWFGTTEVLVRALDLVNGQSVIRLTDGRPIRYVHLFFDRHEIIVTAGLRSESYQPGGHTLAAFDPGARAELFRLFPELVSIGQTGWGKAARMTLKSFEARLLVGLGS